MKIRHTHFVFAVTLLVLTEDAMAQSPREQLRQMVARLQVTPSNNALRERIISLGAEIRPEPAILEEARRAFVEGVTIVRAAKDTRSQIFAIESLNAA